MQTLWQLRLFGGLKVENSDTTITRFRSQKYGYLLAYLALYRQQAHAREELAERFWAETDPEAGRTNLRAALASLRRQLEPPGVAAGSVLVNHGREHITLNLLQVAIDVAEFEAHLQAASALAGVEAKIQRLEQAARLYAGPLLPGCYEDWALMERDRLAERYLHALTDLALCYEQRQEFPPALEWARRAVSADPLREASHGLVIRLLNAVGQPAGALRQYQELERLLREHLEMEPAEEIRALVNAPAETLSLRAIPAPVSALPLPPTLPETSAFRPPAPPSVLPQMPTKFFGRETRLRELCEGLTSGVRLITITGIGGAGKTRLALEAAHRLTDAFPTGVWFVGLAELASAAQISDRLAATLALPRTPATDPLEQVIETLSERPPSLILLDNFEHLTEGGAETIRTLLQRIPALSLLVTSRQRLWLEGEEEMLLAPLPIPTGGGAPERLREFPSVQLFVNRAQSARPDFQMTQRNAEAIAAICTHLEGIPLALELCAAWAQTLSPEQMRQRLTRRDELLVSRRRDIAPRHRTLSAAIEWSYNLLSPEMQGFFRALSVFPSVWHLAAAEAVAAEPDAFRFLAELQDRSLLFTEERHGEPLFRMLASLRDFAAEQVTEAERAELEERHARYFLQFALETHEQAIGKEQAEGLRLWESHIENFRAALRWFIAHPDPAQDGLRLATTLHHFWSARGYVLEGLDFLTAMLAKPETQEPTQIRADALLCAANQESALGRLEAAERRYQECLAIFQDVGDRRGVADALCYRGLIRLAQRDLDQAQRLMEESLSLFEALGEDGYRAHVLKCLGGWAIERNDLDRALGFFEESMRIYRDLRDDMGRNMMLGELGRLAILRGDNATAYRLLQEHLLLSRELQILSHTASALRHLAALAKSEGDLAAATSYFEQSLAIRRILGEQHGIADLLHELGRIALTQARYADARHYFRASLPMLENVGDGRGVGWVAELLAEALWAGGRNPALAPQLTAILATVATAQGLQLTQLRPELARTLGESAFQSAWAQGAERPLSEAVAALLALSA